MTRVWTFLGTLVAWLRARRYVAAQGLVEYSLLLVLIAMVVIGSLSAVGITLRDGWANRVTCEVEGAGTDPNC